MRLSTDEITALRGCVNRAADDLANWRPQGADEQESHDAGSAEVETAEGALAKLHDTIIPAALIDQLRVYCEQAPAAEPGEGYWDDCEAAYHCGHREEAFTAARLIRETLAAIGFDAPAGLPIHDCCGADASGDHDPDCERKEGAGS